MSSSSNPDLDLDLDLDLEQINLTTPISNSLSNVILTTTPKHHGCKYCGKSYTRKSSHERHEILCEIINENKSQTKHETICQEEENTSIPSTKKLYKIIQELAIKYKNIEHRLNDMQKWVDKKKRKLNVITWLNNNIEPTTNIQSWIQSIQVTEEHIEILIEHNMIKTINAILKNNLSSSSSSSSSQKPLYCIIQKVNLFYCYNSKEEKWTHFSTEEFIIMLKRIHSKILAALCEWYDKNVEKINQSDKMQILYNKTMIKLMGANFTQESQILSKIRSELYNQLKTDFTNLIEYEFEF